MRTQSERQDLLEDRMDTALSCFMNQQFPEAEELFRAVLEEEPGNSSALNNLAETLRSQGKLDEAVALFRQLLESTPDNAIVWKNLSISLQQDEQWDEAESALRSSLSINDKDSSTWHLLGCLLLEQERRAEAISSLQNSLKLDPQGELGTQLKLAHLGVLDAPSCASGAFVKRMYAQAAAIWDQSVGHARGYAAPLLLQGALSRVMPDAKDLTILDAGCGTGLCAPMLKPMAKYLVGVDLSDRMLERAVKKSLYTHLVLADITAYVEANPNTFDLIVSAGVLIHFGDLLPLFTAVANSLTSRGLFAFTVFKNSEDRDYSVDAQNFYSHSKRYLLDVAARTALRPRVLDEHIHEYWNGSPVPCFTVILEGPGERQ